MSVSPGPLARSTLLRQRYSIEKQVGTGGFGVVYKARDTVTKIYCFGRYLKLSSAIRTSVTWFRSDKRNAA